MTFIDGFHIFFTALLFLIVILQDKKISLLHEIAKDIIKVLDKKNNR